MLFLGCFSPAVESSAEFDSQSIDRIETPPAKAQTNDNVKLNLPHSLSSPPAFAPPRAQSQSSSHFPASTNNKTASQLDSSTWESEEPDTLLSASIKRLRRVKSQIAQEKNLTLASSAEQLALFFSNSYLEAVGRGDGKWASSALGLSKQFSEQICFVAPDGQRFEGKSSVIGRLNKGVDQLGKMTGKMDKSSICHQFDLQPLVEPLVGRLASSSSGKASSFIGRILSRLKREKPAPPAPAPAPSLSVTELKFKACYEWTSEGSARALRIKDVITIRNGLIVSVVRSMSI